MEATGRLVTATGWLVVLVALAELPWHSSSTASNFFWCLFPDSPHVNILLLLAAAPVILNMANIAKSFCPQCWTKMTSCWLQNFAKLPADACFQVCLSNGRLLGVYHACIVRNQNTNSPWCYCDVMNWCYVNMSFSAWQTNVDYIIHIPSCHKNLVIVTRRSPPRNGWPARLLQRWIGNGLKLDYIIIHDLREVTPTMRSLTCSLAWLFVACFLKAEKSGAAQ